MILVVEKLDVIQSGIRETLAQDLPGCRLTMYQSIDELEKKTDNSFPDMVIISLLFNEPGEQVQNIIRTKKLFPGSSIVTYGLDLLPDEIRVYYNTGINGYCSLEGQDLTTCIRAVNEGKIYYNSAMVDLFVFQLQSRDRDATVQHLTKRQYQIACNLAKGMSITLIAKKFGLHVSTVSTFKMQIFRKLDIKSVVELPAKLSFHP